MVAVMLGLGVIVRVGVAEGKRVFVKEGVIVLV
jgi:hypothetical protein